MTFKELYFSFEGRIGRHDYWMRLVIPLAIISVVFSTIIKVTGSNVLIIVYLVWQVAVIWPSVVVQAKRWHDRNKSGRWIFIGLIPVVGWIWAIVENGFLKGTLGDNEYGPDPLLKDNAAIT